MSILKIYKQQNNRYDTFIYNLNSILKYYYKFRKKKQTAKLQINLVKRYNKRAMKQYINTIWSIVAIYNDKSILKIKL